MKGIAGEMKLGVILPGDGLRGKELQAEVGLSRLIDFQHVHFDIDLAVLQGAEPVDQLAVAGEVGTRRPRARSRIACAVTASVALPLTMTLPLPSGSTRISVAPGMLAIAFCRSPRFWVIVTALTMTPFCSFIIVSKRPMTSVTCWNWAPSPTVPRTTIEWPKLTTCTCGAEMAAAQHLRDVVESLAR